MHKDDSGKADYVKHIRNSAHGKRHNKLVRKKAKENVKKIVKELM